MHSGFATSGFSDALVILGAAGLIIPAFARFRISPVIGFILIGLLVGPAGLGSMTTSQPWLNYVTISNPEAIKPFAEFGIILLLFSIEWSCPSAGSGRCGGWCSASAPPNCSCRQP
jgi:CPA2 family monovalent cation:H+ antiporter-2